MLAAVPGACNNLHLFLLLNLFPVVGCICTFWQLQIAMTAGGFRIAHGSQQGGPTPMPSWLPQPMPNGVFFLFFLFQECPASRANAP